MRKFIITVLAAGMVLSMSGCGSRENVSGTGDRKSTRLNSSHSRKSRMPSSA